jgi:3-oxo-5-alpha-steroid 4-dehydrogenase 1
MSEETHMAAVFAEFALGLVTLVMLLFVTAPYGRHTRRGWGPTISNRVGWIVMESPAVIAVVIIFFMGAQRFETAPLVLLTMWLIHYINRAYVFPFRLRDEGKRMPVAICLLAIFFNLLNATVNGGQLSHTGVYPLHWLWDPRFLIGTVIFFIGFIANHRADMRLLALRAPGETGYKIPRGGLHDYVSAPNYFGEILEWCGWAIATWSLAGAAFAFYSFANLAPRALQHHRWYKEKFSDYPKERRALIPWVL